METIAHQTTQNRQPDTTSLAQFVKWFREVAPYVHTFRGQTFVVAFGGELIIDGRLNALVQDLSLLHALGMKLVLVHGSRPQVNEQLMIKGISAHFDKGMRITDAPALECAKECAGEIRLDIEAAFSQGLPNTPMQGSHVRVISGNFITARPVGIIGGIDYLSTGLVRKVDTATIRQSLEYGSIVLLSPLGFSPTGEAFNLAMEDIATEVAVSLRAEKLIFLTETDAITSEHDTISTELARKEAERLLLHPELDQNTKDYLQYASNAVQRGVQRAHLVPFHMDGSILSEIFTHDGVGTMVVEDTLDDLRPATIDDIAGIVALIEPLEEDGTLIKRGRNQIERDVDYFSVAEHDGVIYACAALYVYPDEAMAEMACLTVKPQWQGSGEADKLLRHIEWRARHQGVKRIFILTTRTAHWFIKHGFVPAKLSDIPKEKQLKYDHSRNSKIFIKTIS